MVVCNSYSFVRHLETNRVFFSAGDAACSLIGTNISACPIVVWILFSLLLFLSYALQPFGCAKTWKSMTSIHECFCVYLIQLASIRLAIWAAWTTDVWALVVLKPQPAQPVNDLLLRARDGSRDIGIFDAQDKLAARLFGEEVIV